MNLPLLLAQDLIASLEGAPDGVPRRVLLWLDPEAQFGRLVPALEPVLTALGVQLPRFDPESSQGQFALKLALLRGEARAEARAVVYLPGFGRPALEPPPDRGAPALWGLYDHRFKGGVWGLDDRPEPGAVPEPPTLLAWLRRHGLRLADDKTAQALAAGGRDSLLARYAERQAQAPPTDWPRPLRQSDVLAALAGDPRDALRELLAAPAAAVRRWGEERALVLERLAGEYGLDLPTGEAGPEALADAAAVQLALAEAWEAFGQPKDFPYLARLPRRAEPRRRLARLLRDDILPHADLRPRYQARLTRLEPTYNLAAWATGRPGQPRGLPHLARTRWQQFLADFDTAAADHWQVAGRLVVAARETIAAGAGSPWEGEPGGSRWAALADLAALVEESELAIREAAALPAVADLVAAYAERWWRIDRRHLRVRAAAAATPGLERVRQVADLACCDYAARVNQRFTDLIEQAPAWPPPGTTGVAALRPALWPADGPRAAVLIVDACRWDLAHLVKERLGGEATLTPVMSTLPSETPFGMSALLPLAEALTTVTFSGNDIVITQAGGPDLASRDGRKAFLTASLVDRQGRPRVAFLDLADLLRGAPLPRAPLLAVFDNTLDEQGHKGPKQLPALLDLFVANLARAVERLHAEGIGVVHLVTDHGFLLLPGEAIDDLGQPSVLPAQALHKTARWSALKPDAPVTEVIRLPLPLAPGVTLGLPRGLRTLVKAAPYLHGGLSLQECVIPHLVARAGLPQVRLGLDLTVTTARLTGGTVPVILAPVVPTTEAGQIPLGLQPLRVRLTVETVPAGEAAPVVVAEREETVRADADQLRPAVYLREGLDLRAGQALILRAIDADTGQELGHLPLTLAVDWE